MNRPSFPAKMPAATQVTNYVVNKSATHNVGTAQTSGIGLESRAVRQRMVDKLAAQGITDAAVLHAMGTVERHRFVDTALVGQAYEDTSLPIGLGQTISKPNVVARMLELLRQGAALSARQGAALSARQGAAMSLGQGAAMSVGQGRPKAGRVLEIGTGCGYQAALLAQLCGDVYSIERLRGLHDKARDNLRPLRVANLHLIFGDGMPGYPKGAPYAAIIAAAGGDALPPAWLDQLAVGGRLVAPVQSANGSQALVVVDKTAQGVTHTVLEAVHFVPLKSGTN